jgi:hypothetical protein
VFDSYAAMFALCDAVLAAIVQHVPNTVRARAERLEELNARFTTWHCQRGLSRPRPPAELLGPAPGADPGGA